MHNTIIIPIDVSHTEKAAAMIAAAKRLGDDAAKFVFVNIVEELPAHISAEFPGGLLDDTKKDAEVILEGLAQESGLDASVEVRIGHAHTSILALADELKADAIIIASHKPGLSDYFLGSTAARVVRHAKCSVFVMR